MSKTIIAVEHDILTFFENGSQTHLTGGVRVHSNEIPEAENAQLLGPEQGFGCKPTVGEGWDCTWTTIMDVAMS